MRVPDAWWWPVSCAINAALLGDPAMPLCARIHRLPDSPAKRAYERAVDRAFGEKNHCRRVHVTWAVLRLLSD